MTEQETAQPVRGKPIMPDGYGLRGGKEMSWDQVEEWLVGARNYWVASTRPNGRPHVMPVWGLWLDGAFYFSTDPQSRKGRNIAANPEVVVHLESGDDVVVLEGCIETVNDLHLLERIADDYETKYKIRVDASPGSFYGLRPRIALAWMESSFPETATRWRFAATA